MSQKNDLESNVFDIKQKQINEKDHNIEDQELYPQSTQNMTCWQKFKNCWNNFVNRTIDYFQYDRVFNADGAPKIDLKKCYKRFLQNYDETYSQRQIKFAYSFDYVLQEKIKEENRKQKNLYIQLYRFICCEGGNEMQEIDQAYKSQRQYQQIVKKRLLEKKEEFVEMMRKEEEQEKEKEREKEKQIELEQQKQKEKQKQKQRLQEIMKNDPFILQIYDDQHDKKQISKTKHTTETVIINTKILKIHQTQQHVKRVRRQNIEDEDSERTHKKEKPNLKRSNQEYSQVDNRRQIKNEKTNKNEKTFHSSSTNFRQNNTQQNLFPKERHEEDHIFNDLVYFEDNDDFNVKKKKRNQTSNQFQNDDDSAQVKRRKNIKRIDNQQYEYSNKNHLVNEKNKNSIEQSSYTNKKPQKIVPTQNNKEKQSDTIEKSNAQAYYLKENPNVNINKTKNIIGSNEACRTSGTTTTTITTNIINGKNSKNSTNNFNETTGTNGPNGSGGYNRTIETNNISRTNELNTQSLQNVANRFQKKEEFDQIPYKQEETNNNEKQTSQLDGKNKNDKNDKQGQNVKFANNNVEQLKERKQIKQLNSQKNGDKIEKNLESINYRKQEDKSSYLSLKNNKTNQQKSPQKQIDFVEQNTNQKKARGDRKKFQQDPLSNLNIRHNNQQTINTNNKNSELVFEGNSHMPLEVDQSSLQTKSKKQKNRPKNQEFQQDLEDPDLIDSSPKKLQKAKEMQMSMNQQDTNQDNSNVIRSKKSKKIKQAKNNLEDQLQVNLEDDDDKNTNNDIISKDKLEVEQQQAHKKRKNKKMIHNEDNMQEQIHLQDFNINNDKVANQKSHTYNTISATTELDETSLQASKKRRNKKQLRANQDDLNIDEVVFDTLDQVNYKSEKKEENAGVDTNFVKAQKKRKRNKPRREDDQHQEQEIIQINF